MLRYANCQRRDSGGEETLHITADPRVSLQMSNFFRRDPYEEPLFVGARQTLGGPMFVYRLPGPETPVTVIHERVSCHQQGITLSTSHIIVDGLRSTCFTVGSSKGPHPIP